MSLIKSLSVGEGDFFYIDHNSDNFTIIDCCIKEDRERELIDEVSKASSAKGITRFISTHPHDDHIHGLEKLDDAIGICNFYRVNNRCSGDGTPSFERYARLRDDAKKSFSISKDCSRKWMNQDGCDEDGRYRGSSGINILWPDTDSPQFKGALKAAEDEGRPNNISPVIRYSLEGGVRCVWMGDLEAGFMDQIIDKVDLGETDILFAPHHGRISGKVPKEWLERMDPLLIVVGEAPSQDLDYYAGYDTVTQNSAGDILFDCRQGYADVFVSNGSYFLTCLADEAKADCHGMHYAGTLRLRS